MPWQQASSVVQDFRTDSLQVRNMDHTVEDRLMGDVL